MSRRKATHRRIWLAPGDPDSLSAASYTISEYETDGEMEITITDCYRKISLSLRDRRDLRKINKLIDFLQEAVAVHEVERDK
jgi:hypothetical protein